jgi:hypothetical protein
MSCSHGDLFGEIGELVLAAQAGRAIDLSAKSGELAQRYRVLGISEELIAKAITRSIGAISFSMARVTAEPAKPEGGPLAAAGNGALHDALEDVEVPEVAPNPAAKALFPSGVRLALIS